MIKKIVYKGFCTGCGTCAGVCPNKVLKMEITAAGNYVPKYETNECNNCASCLKVCPSYNENYREINKFIFDKLPFNYLMGNFTKCYKGYSNSPDIRWQATSGGLISTFLIYLLKNKLIDGALLTKTYSKSPLKAQPFIARKESDIIAAIGAKYVPVPLNSLLSELHNEKGRFAVVGLPCHIQGIRRAELKMLSLREKIVYHFGLVCSHTINLDGIKFIIKKMGISINNLADFKYRGEGWPGGLKILSKNGQKKFLPNQNSWWSELFGAYFFSNYYCTICPDHLNEFSDISFADAWLPDTLKNDRIGTSIAITRTGVGENLINNLISEKEIDVTSINSKAVVNSQLWPLFFKKRNIKARTTILKMLGRDLPKNIYENEKFFLAPGIFDYFAAILIYLNMIFSKNIILKKFIGFIPFRGMLLYRSWLKKFLLKNRDKVLSDNK